MIYESPDPLDPVRQGDIFANIPRIDISLENIKLINEHDHVVEGRWTDFLDTRFLETISPDEASAVVGIRAVLAIVITQDCDCVRSPDITLCEIKRFHEVYPQDIKDKPKNWVGVITQKARANYGWFYLPVDANIRFVERMGARFSSVVRVDREDLERMRAQHRVGRLNEVATEHFRERLSEFFRRYPYNEWYPLTREEFETYKTEKGPVEPYPWQK